MDLSVLETIALYALPVVLAITLHEAAHGYVARHFGDHTAWHLGRVTLNPLKHIDPVGTVLVPLALFFAMKYFGTGFIFGWAKPVPVNFGNLQHPKRDMLWVAAAGPGVNLVMAALWALVLRAANGPLLDSAALADMATAGVAINVLLMVLNLLPVPPLDGGRMAVSLLPTPIAVQYARLEPFGFVLVIALLATGMLGRLLGPPTAWVMTVLRPLAGL